MRISIQLNKSVHENAALYFNKAKKAKKKLDGAKKALERSLSKLSRVEKKLAETEEPIIKTTPQKKEWYEKFRWFITSDGFLVIGGRDATTNEIIIKKHTLPGDMVFHTDMAGSPFFVIKSDSKEIPESTLKEAADATLTFSRAPAKGFSAMEVFYVKPEQVSKNAPSGEYLKKGSFIIRGKTNYIKAKFNVAIGLKENKIISGPVESVKKQTDNYVVLELTDTNIKTSETAKKIQKVLGGGVLDEIIRAMPSAPVKVSQKRDQR